MATQLTTLPINIPWKLIATSPDMLDMKFCNKQFPFAWRSSLAISAYELKKEDLPEELCGDQITYLKITCSITGYQPSKEETDLVYNSFSDLSTEDQRHAIERILSEYFACYGVLLNVAVFPSQEYEYYVEEFKSIKFADFKKIADLPNPLQHNEVIFRAADQPNNRTVDKYPANGDGIPELDLFKQMEVTFPTSFEVRATVVHYSSESVSMKAYKSDELVGQNTAGPEEGQIHDLRISKEGGIDRVVFEAPGNKAYLLTLSLFHRLARSKEPSAENLPRIIDFEPKVRDLYQAATESGEILTASVSAIKTDKSYTHTESSETGLSLGAEIGGTSGPVSYKGQAGLSHTWGETESDSHSTQTDASRERQEKYSSSTELNQMYNQLTGYHPGTNRAVFLMLPRPHILQPTDHRSFIQGVRIIEGIQDFFLIVTRPKTAEGLCVEAFLETAHFPEEVNIVEPLQEYEYKNVDFEHGPIRAQEPGWLGSRNEKSIDGTYSGFEDDIVGWYFDPTHGKPGRGGIDELEKYSDDNADGPKTGGGAYPKLPRMEGYFFNTTSPDKVIISGKIRSGVTFDVIFHRKFRVYLRKLKPATTTSHADVARLLITSRGLCTCFKPVENCYEIMNITTPCSNGTKNVDCIVAEIPIKVPSALLTRETHNKVRLSTVKELLRKIHFAMSTSWRLPNRKPFGAVGFLASDYFKDRIQAILPKEILSRSLKDMKGLSPSLIKEFGERDTLDQVLKLDLRSLMRKANLTLNEAIRLRLTLLGIKELHETK